MKLNRLCLYHERLEKELKTEIERMRPVVDCVPDILDGLDDYWVTTATGVIVVERLRDYEAGEKPCKPSPKK